MEWHVHSKSVNGENFFYRMEFSGALFRSFPPLILDIRIEMQKFSKKVYLIIKIIYRSTLNSSHTFVGVYEQNIHLWAKYFSLTFYDLISISFKEK